MSAKAGFLRFKCGHFFLRKAYLKQATFERAHSATFFVDRILIFERVFNPGSLSSGRLESELSLFILAQSFQTFCSCVCACVREREKERERERMCVCVKRERESVCVFV